MCWLRGNDEEDDEDDGGGTEREPACIGTNVSGLHATYKPAQTPCTACKCGACALDDQTVHEPAKDDARKPKDRRDDQATVDFIDPVLVIEQVIERLEALGQRSGCSGLAVVKNVCHVPANSRSQNRNKGENEFGTTRGNMISKVLCRIEDRSEEVLEFVMAAKGEWNTDLPVDEREHTENREWNPHDCGRLMDSMRMSCLA